MLACMHNHLTQCEMALLKGFSYTPVLPYIHGFHYIAHYMYWVCYKAATCTIVSYGNHYFVWAKLFM